MQQYYFMALLYNLTLLLVTRTIFLNCMYIATSVVGILKQQRQKKKKEEKQNKNTGARPRLASLNVYLLID